ncbi:MAG: hypothetical protein ACE366_01590 [Bradymonadia bacterium]
MQIRLLDITVMCALLSWGCGDRPRPTPSPRPASHTPLFVTDHRDLDGCDTCHGEDACERCHQTVLPSSHGPAFGGPAHGFPARQAPERCATCHTPASCTLCHR